MYENILKNCDGAPPEVRATEPMEIGKGVIEESTFRAIEVDSLFDSINQCKTTIGQAVLYRSLTRPLAEITKIQAKQAAVKELAANSTLHEQLKNLVDTAASDEKSFYDLCFGKFVGALGKTSHDLELDGYGYDQYIKGTEFICGMATSAQSLPAPESAYLKGLLDQISGFAETRIYRLMQGPAYRTEKELLTREERKWYIPALKFTPSLIKPVLLLVIGTLFVFAAQAVPAIGPMLMLFALPILMIYPPIVGGTDRDSCIYPLRDLYKNSEEVQETLEALGELDELLCFQRIADSYGSQAVLPEMSTAKRHHGILEGVKNPILAQSIEDYVANDIELQGSHLTFITGPNSGGKTAFCKSLAQVQLMAQIGCYIPAEMAQLTVADRIFYQVPEISHLEDGEGRFGTELKRTRDIFLAVSPESLVILDELSEGTTHEERLETSYNVLKGFYKIGNNTVLITHNHQLVDKFQEENIGQCLQVEFAGESPTFRLVPGISRISHAEQVARNIGFSKEDIEKYAAEKSERRA
ncbi:MAG: DNA mismatch repair protein MutS [Methylococcales bacterium]